jgi:hypothetical protein
MARMAPKEIQFLRVAVIIRERHRDMRSSATACLGNCGRWGLLNWKTVRWGKKYVVLGKLEQLRLGMCSKSPHLPQFQQSAGAPLSGLYGYIYPPPVCGLRSGLIRVRDASSKVRNVQGTHRTMKNPDRGHIVMASYRRIRFSKPTHYALLFR